MIISRIKFFLKVFNSKSQKALRERVEVLRGQDLVDKQNKIFHEDADKFQNAQLKDRAVINDRVSQRIRSNPNRVMVTPNGTNGMDVFIEYFVVFNKKMARSGVKSVKEYIDSGGNKAREAKNAARPRGVKKSKGAKNTEIEQKARREFQSRLEKYKAEKAIQERLERYEKEEARRAANQVKNLKLAGKTALGATAMIGTGLMAKKIYDKNKRKKEINPSSRRL